MGQMKMSLTRRLLRDCWHFRVGKMCQVLAMQSKMVLWRADRRHQVTLVITLSGYVSGYGSSAECDNARRPLCLVTETRRERNTTLWWKADLHLVCRLPCL